MGRTNRSIAILAVLFLAASFYSATAAPKGSSSFSEVYADAVQLFDQGAYAQAKQTLQAALTSGVPSPSAKEAKKAQKLLGRIDGALENLYLAQEAAQKRAEADERAKDAERRHARQQKVLAEAERLVELAEQGEIKYYEKAAALWAHVASERAVEAFEQATDYFEQGAFDEAKIVFERLQNWIEEQKAADVLLRPEIGTRREKRLAEYLGSIEIAKQNQAEAAKVVQARAEERKAQTEADRKYRETLRKFDDAVIAFDKDRLEEAHSLFTEVAASGVSLGAKKDAQAAEYLAQVDRGIRELAEKRADALARFNAAEDLLAKDDWQAAKDILVTLLPEQALLDDDQNTRLAAMLAQVEEKEEEVVAVLERKAARERLDKESLERAKEYMEEVKRQIAIIRQQEQATADTFVAIAEADYANLRYRKALENLEKALKHVPDHPKALQLITEIRAITGAEEEPVRWISDITSETFKVRMEQARDAMYDAIQRGKNAAEQGRYDETVKHFTDARETLNYLRPHFDVRSVESQLEELLENAEEARTVAAKKLEQIRLFEARKMRDEEARKDLEREGRAVLTLFREATKEYNRDKYDSAIVLIDQLLEKDPGNLAALDLKEKATEGRKKRAWDAIYAAKAQAIEDERIQLHEKLIFPAHPIIYPAREVWDNILGREAIMTRPAEDIKMTPREQELEKTLDEMIEAFSFEETPLDDVINFFKLLPQFENVNFVIDEERLMDREVFITRTLNNVTLRQALGMMLRPRGLNFVISNDAVFISTDAGVAEEEARHENMYFYQYDVRDLLVDLEVGAAGNNDGGNNDGGNTTTTDGNNDGDGDGDRAGAGGDLVELIQLFTGPQNWDVAGAIEGAGRGGNNNERDGGGFGEREDEGGLGGLGGLAEMAGFGGRGASRIMLLRRGYLMINHVDRLHRMVQQVLSDLRAQITIQVLIEGRYVTYSDLFYKDVGVDWGSAIEGGPALNWSRGEWGWIPASNIRINPFSPTAAVADPGISTTGGLLASITFLNDTQTQAIVNAVKNSRHATTVAAPHVIVMDTEEQELSLTVRGSYISGYTVDEGFAIPNLTSYTKSTTSLTVTPVVSADRRYVTMAIELDVSKGDLIPIEGGAVIPIRVEAGEDDTDTGGSVRVDISTVETTDNSIQSLVRVPDRGTLVLGGLSDVSETTGAKSIPILCHLPILKRLFERSAVSKVRVHNIFMVTPTILLQEEVEP